jgi:hypothetical protein
VKAPITSRYELTEKGEVVIDVSVPNVGHLYSNFDRTAPHHKKDLDQELVDYIVESVREVRRFDFIIRISLPQIPDESLTERVRRSFNTYYAYLQEIELRSLKNMFKRSGILFVVGLIILAMAIEATRRLSAQEGVLAEVFSQGLTVAAWVSLWEAIANLFLEWGPHRTNISIFEKIKSAPVTFRQIS